MSEKETDPEETLHASPSNSSEHARSAETSEDSPLEEGRAQGASAAEATQPLLGGSAPPPTQPGEHGQEVRRVVPRGPDKQRVGNYELLEKIAEGGMGAVYRARHVKLQRIVALKMIKAGVLAGEDEIRRFLAEAEVVAQLDHPGIVPLYEVGQWQPEESAAKLPFLAMGFVEGESLDQRLRQGPLQPEEAAWITLQMAEAMQYAHDKGIIHRDLKPANVLLQKEEELSRVSDSGKALAETSSLFGPMPFSPRITDFGLAKRLDADSQMTRTGQVMGTPSYMPPEQARGDLPQVGPLSDVYSLGATLYALLVGRPPFQAANVLETLKQVLEQEPISPRSLNPAVNKDLETICLKCLEKEPTKRYGSARELAEDLRRFLQGYPIAARPVSKAERLWRWCRRNRALAAVGTAALVLLLTLAVGGPLMAVYQAELKNQARQAAQAEREAKHQAEQAAGAEKRARQQAVAESRRAFRNYYAAQMNLIQRDWQQSHIAPLLRRLEAVQPERTGGEDLRGFEWFYWQRLCRSHLRTLAGHRGPLTCVAFRPDGKYLAAAGHDRTIRLWDVVTGKVVRTLQGHADVVTGLAFSPAGDRLASASLDETIKLWDVETGRELRTLKGHQSDVLYVAFAPKGKHLASTSLDGTIKLWDAQSGRELLTLRGHTSDVWSVAFGPNGTRLASAGGDETVKVWDVESGQVLLNLRGHTSDVWSVAFGPDGRRLASASWDGTVVLWDAATGKKLLALRGHTAEVRSVAFSPDGRRLVSAGRDRTVRVWEVESGRELLVLRGHTDEVARAVFSPDGTRLATASFDGTVKLWDATQDPKRLVLQGHTDAVTCVAFHPRGRYLASASQDRSVRVWDLLTARQRHVLGDHPSYVYAVAFSPQGELLASGSWLRTVRLWEVATGAQRMVMQGRGNVISSLAFTPDGRRLATAGGEFLPRGGELNVWDVETGKNRKAFFGRTDFLTSVAFSPDGRRLALAGWNRVVQLWDAATGEKLLEVKGHAGHVYSIAFSPNGSRLVTASEDGTVRVWDAATGREQLRLTGHQGAVHSVCFSPDGRRLVSAGEDATIRVWDATAGHELLTLRGHQRKVFCVTFSPDGTRLASAGEDRTVQVWDARSWTPKRRVQFEALGLVRFLLQIRKLPPHEAMAWLKRDSTHSQEVLQEALRLIRPENRRPP